MLAKNEYREHAVISTKDKMNKISVVSPASKCLYRKGVARADYGGWDSEFLGRATKKDATGFPEEGAFGLSFAAKLDLNKVAAAAIKEEVVNTILKRTQGRGVARTKKQAERDARQLISAFKSLRKGDTIAFKCGTKVIAIVELTSDYTFCNDQPWGWHSWSYRTIKKVADTEQPKNRGALLPTFMPNFLEMPTIQAKTPPMPYEGAWSWA